MSVHETDIDIRVVPRDDAYALISVACDVNITQLVDTNSGVHVMCPKDLFTKTAQTKSTGR